MKCQFCGKSTSKLFSGPNDIALCEECHNAYNKNTEESTMGDIVEMKPTDVVVNEPEVEIENPVRCELIIGVKKDGQLYFNVGGYGADLLIIDGLLKYADRRARQEWDIRDIEIAKAAQEKANREKEKGGE